MSAPSGVGGFTTDRTYKAQIDALQAWGDYVAILYPPVWTLLSVGNIVSLLVFLRSSMRKSHTSVYLATLAVIDTVSVNSSSWCNIHAIVQGKTEIIQLV